MRLRPCQPGALAPLLALLAGALIGLGRVPEVAQAPTPAAAGDSQPAVATVPAQSVDLSAIRFRREFRVLTLPQSRNRARVPGHAGTSAQHHELIETFAEEQFLLPRWITVPRREDLVPALLRGDGDLVGVDLRIRDYRSHGALFSVPVGTVREVLFSRAADRARAAADLSGREIALRARSSFWPLLHRLRRRTPDIGARIIPDDLPPEVVLQRVQSMAYDMAVLDATRVGPESAFREGLAEQPWLSSAGHVAFGVRPGAVELKAALDDFLTRKQLARRETVRRTDDLDGIARRGVLRVLTRNNAASYFIWRGRPLGFEYELIGKFADEQGLSLEMIVAPSRAALLPALRRGEGDVVAAGLSVTEERRNGGTAFTRPYKESYEMVVTRADETVQTSADLAGRTITVHRSSPVWGLIEALRADGLNVGLEAAPEELETETIIERVANGLYDLTVADAHSVKVALTWRTDVRAAFALDGPVPIAWAVREGNPRLREALDAFIERERRQVFYNVIYARYFENPRRIRAHVAQRADNHLAGGRISPYDEIVRRYAEKYGFDWVLIVALMYRESRFNPRVVSWAGARGLMQLLPVTAKRFGVTDLENPEASIQAGVRMLDWLYQQFEPELPVKDRTWFALAAYNAGLGHLLDARRLARELGLDAERWFDNVEQAMLLLSEPRYYRQARYGYVRGIEPVTYVRDIRELYNAYRSMLRS
jgi:membrane-bound lytic murein transglycosylase F